MIMTILQVGLQQSARILLVMVSYESIMVRILRRLSPSRIETITIVMVSILDGDIFAVLVVKAPTLSGDGGDSSEF